MSNVLSYPNIPAGQHFIHKLVDEFNADERIWKKLEPLRKLRRKLNPRMNARQRKRLELLDFAQAQPPKDCVGRKA